MFCPSEPFDIHGNPAPEEDIRHNLLDHEFVPVGDLKDIPGGQTVILPVLFENERIEMGFLPEDDEGKGVPDPLQRVGKPLCPFRIEETGRQNTRRQDHGRATKRSRSSWIFFSSPVLPPCLTNIPYPPNLPRPAQPGCSCTISLIPADGISGESPSAVPESHACRSALWRCRHDPA